MIPINTRQNDIVLLLAKEGRLSGARITELLDDISLATVKRDMRELVERAYVRSEGRGRGAGYVPTEKGRLFMAVDAHRYCATVPDERYGSERYNFALLPAIPPDVFSEQEAKALDAATAEYKRRTRDLSPTIQKKELERLVIELSWKSSRIEGNTYTLLDTEKLILEGIEAPGHSKDEARMILNHKEAFTFVHENAARFAGLTRRNLEELHAVLVKDLGIGGGLRSQPVGVLGSRYRPLDNLNQITDAVADLSSAVERASSPYAKALIALLGISYIQPFEDGNKRTARLMANALLLAHGRAPLSYRSVDEEAYREAILVFYELNSLTPFRELFVAQYDFAARNYAAK